MRDYQSKIEQELRIRGLFNKNKASDWACELKDQEFDCLRSEKNADYKLRLRQINRSSLSFSEKQIEKIRAKEDILGCMKFLVEYSNCTFEYALTELPEKEQADEQKLAMKKLLCTNEKDNILQQDPQDDGSEDFSINASSNDNAVQDDFYSQVPLVNDTPAKSWSNTILCSSLLGGAANVGLSPIYWNWTNGFDEDKPFDEDPYFILFCVIKGVAVGAFLGVLIQSRHSEPVVFEDQNTFPNVVNIIEKSDVENQNGFVDDISAMTDGTEDRILQFGLQVGL